MEERLEMLEDALWNVNEAAQALKDVGGHEDIVAALEGTASELRWQIEEAEAACNREAEHENRAMTAEYWRSVL